MLGIRKRGKNDTVQIQLLDGIGLILATTTASTEATAIAITVTVTTASTEATAIAITITITTATTTATTATRHYSTPLFVSYFIYNRK
ncbi:hypothetical protein C4A77_05725 [Brevibacillus laterosporus]|uniref:Uncharacterized protein n=1 Tax=Brevibacillus laterosporus TaxID=1465 RepID=A0AAP8QFS8_BRELA|nr:hypothetical protein C4A77_05725 [Brevibacillus laterosporus]